MKKLLAITTLGLSLSAQAGLITLNFDQAACVTALSTELTPELICSQINQGLDEAINQDFPDTDFSGFTQDTANSLAIAGSAVSDYSDNFSYFVLKPSFGAAFSVSDTNGSASSVGAGFSGNLLIGFNLKNIGGNLGFIDLSRTDLFINYFNLNLDQNIGDGSFGGSTSALGIYARYLLVTGGGYDSAFEWGGIYLHTGIQKTNSKLNFTLPINLDAGVTVQGETGNIQNASFAFELDSDLTSVPVEVSTYINFLYAFTLYGGLGFDLHMGSTDMNIISKGDLILESRGNADLGDIGYDNLNNASPESGKLRSFVGAQLNLPYVRLYGQVQAPMGSNTIAFGGGAKIVW